MTNENSKKSSSEYIELLSSPYEDQIILVKSVLDSAGIKYIVTDDSHVRVPHAVIPARILVKRKDVKKARKLLEL